MTPAEVVGSLRPADLNSQPSPLLAAALAYAQAGWLVVPLHTPSAHGCSCGRTECTSPGKHPRTKNGLKDASSDPATIREWWSHWPDANIGILTGSPSHVFVLDVDGGKGEASLRELEKCNHPLPDTWSVRTGRGIHLYFRYSPWTEIRNSSERLGPGLDIRGEGGYVVVPPSLHGSGEHYQVNEASIPPEDCPDWLLTLIQKPKQKQQSPPTDAVVEQGQRTKHLVSLAGTMNKRGMDPGAIEAALLAENQVKCSPPLPETKVRDIAHNIPARYPHSRPTPPNGQCEPGETPDTHDATSTTEFSEDALALKFTARYKDDLRYTAAWARWYMWNETHWQEDVVLNVYDRARAVCREEALRCPLPAAAKQLTSARTRAAVENLARSDPRHAAVMEQWDGDEWLLNTPGGTIDLATGQIRKPQRGDYITRSTAVAPDKNCAIPLWNAFLQRITGNDEALVTYLQRMAGYSLTGSIRERAMFFLYGTGTNGKSTLIRTFSGILGDGYARTAPIEAFVESQNDRHPTELAMLRGARFVSAIETEEGRHWAESKLKALTGGDAITARFMRQDFFEFTPSFKLIIAGNHKPSLRSVDEAIRVRIKIVPFLITIPPDQLDLNLGDKLHAEWPGILAWMVEGCKLYLHDGLMAPESVTDATASYFESEDALGRWIEDRLAESPQAFSSSSMLHANWQSWAMAAGEHVGTMKALVTALGDRFRALGWKVTHGRDGCSGPSGFFGVTTKG